MKARAYPRKVLLLSPRLDGTDGISAVGREVLLALARQEAPPELAVWTLEGCPDTVPETRTARIEYRSASGNRLRFALWGLGQALRSASDILVVVLHVHLTPVALPMAARGARLVVFLYGIEGWRRLPPLRAESLRRADMLVAISRHTAELFKEANSAFKDRDIRVCHLGTPEHAAESTNPPPPGPFALIVGRMASDERYKGHDVLIHVWPKVIEQVPNALLLVVGDGDDRCRLESMTRQLGLEASIRFLGRVSEDRLTGLYRDCTFFTMPSRNEGFGLVFVEAMRAGKACIAGKGAAAEVVQHEVTGLIVAPEAPDEVLGAILRLYKDDDLRKRMGKAGAERFEQHFTRAAFQKRLATVLQAGG
jgi:phosphatidylinositol alpha-1,6-mannosyltransferase